MRLRRREALAEGREWEIHHEWVALEDIPGPVCDAVRLGTDPDFFRHHGVDWAAIRRAWRYNRACGWKKYGGSTITVQAAKNLFFHPRKTYWRKAAEIPVAYAMELLLGKNRIFEIYLNIAEWGDGIFGIEAAARHHYGKSVRELSLSEAAMLAAVIRNPRRWSPRRPSLHILCRAAAIRRSVIAATP